MATIIDSLLITMGMDTSAYRKGQREVEDGARKVNEAERSRGKESAAASKAMAEGFRVSRNELMSLVGIALGATGVKNFFAGMVKDQASLGRFAKDLNMSARELDAWGAAAEQVGGTAEGMRSSMQSILGGFEAYSLGENSPAVQAFRALSVDIADGSGKIRPMKDLLLDVAAALQKVSAQDQIRLGSMLGLDRGTLDLLRQGSAQVGDIVAQMEKASGVTDESTKASAKAQAQWASFNRELKGVGQTIFSALIPGMDDANGQMRQFSGWINDHKDEIGQFVGMLASGFSAVGRAIGDAFGWFYKLGEKLAGTSIGDKLGQTIAKVLAYGGNKEAQASLAATGAGAPVTGRVPAIAKPTGAKTGGSDFDAFVKAAAPGNLAGVVVLRHRMRPEPHRFADVDQQRRIARGARRGPAVVALVAGDARVAARRGLLEVDRVAHAAWLDAHGRRDQIEAAVQRHVVDLGRGRRHARLEHVVPPAQASGPPISSMGRQRVCNWPSSRVYSASAVAMRTPASCSAAYFMTAAHMMMSCRSAGAAGVSASAARSVGSLYLSTVIATSAAGLMSTTKAPSGRMLHTFGFCPAAPVEVCMMWAASFHAVLGSGWLTL